MKLEGFDAEFKNLDDFIRVITARIWEGRRIDDIYTYYTDPCVVETPTGVSSALVDVVNGTRATLAAFPDRRLLCEDVIGWGARERGYYSSHRIISPMTHAGAGVFGEPTGAKIHVRTIADCWCIENRIAHEWLVRDQSAIAKAINISVETLAKRWLDATQGIFSKPVAPAAPLPFAPHISNSEHARAYAQAYSELWSSQQSEQVCETLYDEAVHAITPAETHRYGRAEMAVFWRAYFETYACHEFAVEHLIEDASASGLIRTAMRWRVQSVAHQGGNPVEIMGISHAQWRDGRVLNEWVLIDEIALAMQRLSAGTNCVESSR